MSDIDAIDIRRLWDPDMLVCVIGAMGPEGSHGIPDTL